MADRLQGISFTEADFISMLKDFVSEGDVTKKINVDVKGADQGAKDISKVSDALTKLNSIKTDDVTNLLTTITTLLTKRFQGVNLNLFTSKLISAFLDPAKSAADLADIIHDVYTDLTTLASVTNAKSFGGFSESDIRKTIAKQKKVLDLKKQLDVELTTARTDANTKLKPVDILTKAKTYKIQRKSAIDVGDSLGIDRSTVNVQNNDDALLLTYQRTADVLSKMISERKEYNKLNKTNVSDYLQLEQDILSVFRQLQSIEGLVSEKFQISSENLLSNQFKNNNGLFDFVENARKAVNAYVTQMTSSTQKAFQNAQDELGKHLARSAERSVDRLSNLNEAIGRTSQKLRDSKSTASSTAATLVGTEIGESVAAGMEKALGATESATSGIEKYLLSAELTIGKLKELRLTLEDLDTEYLDSDMSDEKIEKKIQDTSTESLRYIANLRRLGYSKQDIDLILGKTLDDENWTSYIDTYAKESNANKDIIKRISTYKDQSIAETPTSLNPTSIEETRSAIEETKSSIEVLLEYLNQLKTQDLGNLSTGFDLLPPKIREAINELGLLNKETDKLNFADTGHTNHGVIVGELHTLISKNANSEKYALALQLKDALDLAADAGANVARILDIAFDSSTNTMLQLLQTASGDLISNIPGYGESSDNLKFNEALLEATDELIIKLINDLETLNSLGINVDFTDSNFLYDKQKGFSIIDLAMKDQGASDYGASDLLEMFGFIRDEFSYAGKDTSAVDSFIERIKTAITLREELLKPGGNTGLLDTTDAEGKINSLKDELASLREELQRFKDTGVEPEGITELQTKLEGAEQRAESLSSELSLLYGNSVDTATYQQLEEELLEAKASAESLKESLAQVRTELEESKTLLPLDPDALDKKVTELLYLHDKIRTIYDGKDGIINEDMTYSEKFDSSEVQRMIELLNQLSDTELRAAGVMPDDEDSYNTFRYNLLAEVDAIKETLEMLLQAYDTGNYDGFDASEIDVSIWDRLEHIYEMAQEVTSLFNSNLTPAVREFLSLLLDQVGADNMADFWGSQNVDSYINDIINGTKTAKEAFADLENSFGWDTDRFTSLIDGDVPQELQGLYDQLFSDVENRIKSAEQAAEEFNAKLKEMHDMRSEQQPQKDISSPDQHQLQEQSAESAAAAEEHLKEATEETTLAGIGAGEVALHHQEQAESAEEAAASEEHLKEVTESTAQAGTSASEAAQQHLELAKAAEEAATAEEHLNQTVQEAANTDVGAKEAADAHKLQEEAANAAADAILESAKALDSAMLEEVKQTKIAVDELIKSYERLADAEARATNGSTAVVREKGRTKAEEIKARLAELETKISGKTTAELDAQINAAKAYYERLRTAYENDRARTSKDLGFESGNNVDKTWDTLIDKAQQYENILNKLNNLHKSLTVNESSFLAKYADMYKEAGEKAEEAGEKGKKFNEAIEEALSLIRSNTIDDFSRKIGDLTAEGDNMPLAYNDLVRELRENLTKLKEIDFNPKGGEWGQLVDSINNGLSKLNTDPFMQKATDLSKQTLNRLMSDWINNNSGAGEYLEQVRALLNALSSAASQGDLDNIAAGFEKIKSSAAEAGKTGESFGEGLMKRFKSLGQYLLSFASFYRVIDVFKQAIGVVKELDTALVELKKVSDESTLSYSNFMKNSFDMADDVGTTAQSIISSTADWKRLGESFEEALKSATTSTVLLNVSEFTNIEDATQSLVSASQAYKDLDKMDIVDKLNNIGNNFSVSTDELATGLKNAAAVLATQGNDIDLALALLTAGNAVTLDISKTSAGIRTISLRIAGTEEAKNELADMGEDIDDFVVKTRSKTNSIIQDYTAVASNNYKGVSVLDDNGNLRDTYNILLDIAKVYEEIQAEDKKAGTNRALALIEELAGKNRSNIAASILMNPEMLEDVYNASQRSQGSAQHELDTYLNSIEAKYAQLQNRLQLLAYTAIDADAIKVLLDGLSGAVTLATKLVDVLGTIPSILGVVSAIFMQKSGLGFFNFDKNAAKKFTLGLLDVWERAATSIKLPDKEMVKIFGLMDLSKAYVPQLIKLEEQGAIIPSLMWNVDGIENFDEQLTSAREAMTAFGEVSTGVGGLLSNLGNIAGTVGATLLNAFGSAIVMTLVSFAITGVGKVIDSVIHAKENAILLAKETLEEIDTITSENEAREQFQNSDKYERAIELSSKIAVNKDGYKNISATNDEYQEYISLCNEIAGIYPEVVSSYDELGNAIINLGSNAEEAKTKLDELNKASAIAEGFKLKGTSNDTWRGNRVQISDILRERDEALAELDNLKTTKDVFSNDTANNLRELLQSLEENGFVNIDIGALSGQDYELLEKSIRDVADNLNMDLFISPTSGTNGTLDLMLMSPVKEADTWTLFYSTVAASVPEAASEASLAILEASGKVESANNEANNILHELLENSWLELSHSVSYMLLVSGDSILEEAIKNGIFSISLEDVQDVDDIQGWIETNYLKPITQAFVMDKGSAAQDAINNLFTLDTSKLSATKYDQALKDNLSIVEEFYKSIGQEELYESFLINYDFAFKTPNGQIIKNDKDAVYREIQDYLQDETLTDESKAELDSLTWDQLISVEDLVKDGSFSGKLSDAIKKVVNKASQKATPTDTLKTLLSDETFKSDVDYANYEGNLSSLTSALETLRTEGSLTAETMVSLLKSMPSLTDFTEGSLKDAAFQQLDSWIQRIRKGMSTMSEEGKEQTRTMIQNMIDQYGDLGLTLEDIYDEYWQVQGVDKNTTAGYEQIKGQKQFFDAQVDELRSRLAAEGKELDTHVLYTLIASDQFSGTADEIYNAYNDAEVLWHLIADNTELEKQVQRAQLFLAGEDSKISLKEAKGETVTPRDYNFSRLYASQIMNGLYAEAENAKKARDAIDKDVDPETWNTNNISYVNALAAAMDAEAKAALIEKAQIDSSLNEYRNAVADADNAVTKALVAIDDAEAKVGEGMADQSLYDALAEALLLRSVANMDLSEAQKDLFDQYIDTHPEWAKEWLNDSFSSYSSAQSDNREADAQSNKLYQKNLNLLNEDATRTQRELTIAEQNHLKASASTYRDLISNGRAQIENLRAQLHEVENDITAWRSYLDLIESMEDSIYDWSKTMDQLVVTLASELASTLSSAMSEQFSDTGLTSDTMDALLTAFSDLTGNNLDISDVFYNTADGIKVNTLAIEELTEAEFDLQSAQLQLQIDMVLEALERNPGNSALNQKLQLLMQTLALYFAQYEEMRKALSYNGAMSLAELTTNLGANFDSNINRYSTYAEAYKKGYVGTDDFEAWTAYLDVYGRTGKDIYEGVKDKAERYFGLKKDDSADEIAGLQNFLNDLEKLGYATKSETTPGGYDLKFDSYENASKAMGMGQEWFEDMLGKLEERGFDIMSVSSLTDSALLMQDLEAQRKLALATYMDMRDRGASKEDLSSQLELVDELGTKMLRLSTLTEDWLQTTEDARKMNFANLQSNLAELERLASETEDEATKNLYREEAAKEAAEFGYTLKEGGFSLSEADAADYASRFVGGTLLSPLSAAQMGYGPEVADKYVAMINKVSEAYLDEDSNVLSLVDTLNGYDKDKLWDIDHADGKWSDGEKEVELLCDALGVGYDNAKLLIDALAGLGLIKTPDSITSLPDTFAESKQQLDGLLATARKGSGAAYQIDTSDDYTGKTLDLLRTQLSEVRQMLADTVWDETNLGAKDYLEQLDRNVTARIEIETVLSEGDTTLKLLLDMSDEELAAKFNVDVDSDEFTALKLLLELLLNSYDLEIHIDDTLFDQLMTALVGEDWETTVNVKADTEEYEETVSSLEPPDGTNTGEQGPDSTPSNPVLNATQSGQNAVSNFLTGNNVTATENETGYTGFTEELDLTEQTAENVSVNAQNVLVNDDTNTPGSIAKGESLTSEQRLEYSSASETTESEEEGVIETSTAVINADAAEVNSELPNETETNYQSPVEESSYQFMNPSNPFEYGLPQPLQYLESWQPPVPTSTPMESAVPGEVSTGNMSVTAGSVTVSGPVTTLNTQTETPTPSFTTAPTVVPTTESANANVSVDADTSAIETVTSALDDITDKTVTITVNEEGVSTTSLALTAIYTTVGLVDGQDPTITVKEDGVSATSDALTAVYTYAGLVDQLSPTVSVDATDNATSVMDGVISKALEVDAQTPNVNAEATDSASDTLETIISNAARVEDSDPNVAVSINDGGAVSVLDNIFNRPPLKEITVVTHYRFDGNPTMSPAAGTFHPAHALGTVKSAFADGTVGEAWNKYSRENGLGAYAGGSDVTLKHDLLALTSELGQESIVRNGHWYLLDSHPHMELLKKGDIVFNASQTKDLLEHGRANGHGRVAYANGTAYNTAPAFVKMTEELRKEKTGNPKIVKSTNGKGHVEIVNDNNWVDKVTNAVTRMGQEISQALDTPDDNTNTWSDDYAQIHLLNDQSLAIQANTAATQNNTKVKNQEATYVDFAEKVMNRLSKATARLQNRITEFTTYTFKKNTLRAELDSLADEIAATSAALPVYAEYLQMLRNTPIQHESSGDGGGGGGSDSGSDSGAEETAETNEEEAATRLETAKSNLKAAKQNLKDNYKLSDEQKKKLKNNKKIDESEIKGSNKKNAASVYNDALKQYKLLKKQEDTATETTAKETSKAAKNTEQNTAEVAQTSSQTASHTGAVVSSAEAVEASGYDIASYTELGAAAGSDTVTILQTISGQIAGLSTQIADISVNVNIDGGSASVSSGGGGSKSSGSSDDDDGGSGGSKNGKDVDDYSWSKKNQEAIENGEKIDISTIDPSKKNKIAAAKAYNKSLKNGGGNSSSSGSSKKSSGSSNKGSGGNVKSKSGDGGVSVSSGSGKGHTASAEEKQFKKEMKAAAKEVKNSYTLTSDQQKAIKKGETLSTKGITDSTKKSAFKAYNQAVKKYNNARLSTSVSSNAPISPNNDPLHNENMRALSLVEAAQAKAGKGGGGGGSIGGIDPSSVPASSSDKAAESIYDTLNGDYLGEFANILEDNDLIAILGLDKDLASALEEYDEFLSKLEDTKDSLEQLYQQVVSVWDELAQAPLEEADRQIEQLELGIDGLTAALGRLDSAMAGGSTLNVLDTIRETEKAAADYTATSQAVLDAIRDVNADKTDNAARQVEIRRWAVDEAKQVLEDAQKAMDEVTRDADEKIAEYKKTREETEKKLAEAQATATSTAAAVSSLEQNEYIKRYKEIEAKKALAPTGGIFSKLLGIKQTEPRQNGFLSDDMPSSPYASILTGLGARQNSNDPLKRIFGFNSGADSVIEQYTEAVKKAGEATAEVTTQLSALRESTLLLAQAELDKTLREEMQAEILQLAKLAYDLAQTALAQAESEYAAQYIQEVVDNFSAVEEAFESVLRYQKALDENEELYVKNAEERGNRITAAMRQFQSGNILGQTATLRAEIAALNEELSGDRLVYGSKEWNDLMSQILDKETELNDLLNQQHGILLSILSDVKEHYSVLIDHLEQVNKLNDAWIDTARAIGDYETELSYIQRYAEQLEMVALYLQQSADALELFNNLVARGELIAGTDEYIAKQTEVLSLINDAKSAQNDLREIEADRIKYTIERYEELLDRVDNYVDIIKALGGLISEAAKFDYDTGNLTDMGQASIAIEMTAWQENTELLRDVLEERQRLRDEFASNPNFGEKEFAEALDANDKQIQEYLSNIKGAADNIVEIGITIAEKQLAAINKTIDARKKALSLEQDYYNYDKSLKNSTKDIELLNAQIRALEGVSDAESKAMKARLEAQRDELLDNLNDQVREHVVNLQTEGLTEMQEQLADNLDEWRNELQGDIQKQLDYINSINMSASNIEAALNKLVLGASNGVATLSDVETAVKENGLLTSTVSDVNKQYEEGHAKAVATKLAQDAGAELAARIQGAINTLGTSVSTANIDKFTKEWAAVTDKANYNIGSTDQTGKDIQALIDQLKSDVSQNQSMKDWVDAIAAVKSPTYNYSQAQIDAMAKSGNVAKQGYSSVITNAKAVWDKMSAEQKKAYNEVAGAFHAGKTVDQMLATYTNAVDSLNKAVATNVEKAKAEMARKAAEEAKRKAEEEAKRRAAEEAARKKAEEEARKKAEEAAKKKAEEEAKKKAEEEAKQKDPRYRLMGIYNGGGGSYDGPGYSEMLYGVQSVAASTSTNASSEKVYVLTPKANDYILKEGEVLVDQKKTKKKATGTRHAQKGMTLTQEKGGEIITTKDGVLVPLKAGDGVIPANLTDKLFRMAMDYPNIGQTVALPEMKPALTNVTVSYGSLLTVNGNVDKDALPGLQDILKQAYQYTSKQLAIDAKKAGMRQARY